MDESLLSGTDFLGYLCIMIQIPDKLRVIHADETVIITIRQAIKKAWFLGIQSEKFDYGAFSFKLHGLPFSSSTDQRHAIGSNEMAMQVFHDMYMSGWDLELSSDLSQTTSVSSWFFRNTECIRPPTLFLCMRLSKTDTVHFFDSSKGQNQEPALKKLLPYLQVIITRNWRKGIQKEKKFLSPSNVEIFEFKLHGKPWTSVQKESIECLALIQDIFTLLHKHHFVFYVSTNIRDKADSLFFRKKPDTGTEQELTSFVLSLNKNDRIRLVNAPNSVISVTRQTVQGCWLKGLQRDTEYYGSWEFKLKGTPWWAEGTETVCARYFLCYVFQRLKCHGWEVHATVNVSRKETEKSIYLFTQSQHRDLPCICISPHETDKIRVTNASADVVDLIRQVICSRWEKGIQKERMYGESKELKLRGNPWCAGIADDSVSARSLMCFLMKAMTEHNWHIVTSADVSSKYEDQDGSQYPCDVNSWFLSYKYRDENSTWNIL